MRSRYVLEHETLASVLDEEDNRKKAEQLSKQEYQNNRIRKQYQNNSVGATKCTQQQFRTPVSEHSVHRILCMTFMVCYDDVCE